MANVLTREAPSVARGDAAMERLPLPVVDPGRERGAEHPAGSRRMRGLLLAAAVLLVGGGLAATALWPAPDATEQAIVAAPVADVVVGLGTLLPRTQVITVAPPFGASDARIAVLMVEEGDRVAAGATLAVLDNRPALDAAVASARATVAARRAALVQVRTTVLTSRDEARAALYRAGATLSVAEREFERGRELARTRVIATSAQETREAAFLEAREDVARARASLARYDHDDIDAQPDVVVAARDVDAALAELARAEADLAKSVVVAPVAGTVLTIHHRPGETTGENGLLNLGDTDAMTVRVEVYQTAIGKVSPGDPVTVTADALAAPLTGTVTRIGLEVQRQELVAEDPAANTDARVFRVWADLDPASSAAAARFVNLQVRARIGQ